MTFSVDSEVAEQLRALSARTRVPLSRYLQEAAETLLDTHGLAIKVAMPDKQRTEAPRAKSRQNQAPKPFFEKKATEPKEPEPCSPTPTTP